MLIGREVDLARFRSDQLSGTHLLGLLPNAADRAVVVSLPVGIGKSVATDNLIETAVAAGSHDLVVYLAPTHAIIQERRWVKDPPGEIPVVVLRPRPLERCGALRNKRWAEFEKASCYLLGKIEICERCEEQDRCHWPHQYGVSLKGIKVVFGAQAHLTRAGDIIRQLVKNTGAKNPLIIIDENSVCLANYRRKISRQALALYRGVLAEIGGRGLGRYLEQIQLLLAAPTRDLRSWDWSFPPLDGGQILKIQETGFQRHGTTFTDMTPALCEYGSSRLESREKNPAGDILYAAPPHLEHDLFLFTANNSKRLLEFRLGRRIVLPFEDYTFCHPGSMFFNIRSLQGAKRFFRGNAPQILDFFAALTILRMAQNRRVLLVSKKAHKHFCADELRARFCALGHGHITVIEDGYECAAVNGPNAVPIIHYGMVGINDFQEFDCVYCLNSYYIFGELLDDVLQDVVAADAHLELEIRHDRETGRSAGTRYRRNQIYDLANLAPEALHALEIDPVVQAVGRVRPFTRPREVIIFQADVVTAFPNLVEFRSLAEARTHFGICGAREEKHLCLSDKVQMMKAEGLKQRQVAEELGVSRRHVQRFWKAAPLESISTTTETHDCHETPDCL